MGIIRRKFSREFKVEAVRLVTEAGVSISQASRDLEIGDNESGAVRGSAICLSPCLPNRMQPTASGSRRRIFGQQPLL